MDTKADLRQFICKCLKNDDIKDDTNLFESGTISSLFSIQLISFLEKEFNMTIEDEDIVLENFLTINAMDGFINKKTNTQA